MKKDSRIVSALLVVLALGAVASVYAWNALPTFPSQTSTELTPDMVTPAVVDQWEEELSNWGRWGPEDQRGTLNLITPEKTREAVRLVQEGITVTLAHFASLEKAIDNWNFGETEHWMVRVNPDGTVTSALDGITFGIHDGTNSHMDALCHYAKTIDGQRIVFNGYPQNLDQEGCKDLAADRMGPGYVTRAILVDMPLLKDVEWLESSTPIYASDLEEWESFAGVTVGSGDVLLVRTGRWARRATEGPWLHAREAAGLHASVLPWLRERDVALLASDAVNDVQPSGIEGRNRPVHDITQVFIGLPLVDNGYFEDAAQTAARLGRWEFMISWQITKIPGGTASPFNAVGTF